MTPSELLHQAVERSVISGHDGRSGAGLEHVRLADGSEYIVKRVTPASDLTLALTGGTVAREYLLWRSGALDRLPPGVDHAVVDGWVEGDTTVIVMHDLGDKVLTWGSHLSTDETDWVLARVAAMHRRFLGSPPREVVPLDRVLTIFAPEQDPGAGRRGERAGRARLPRLGDLRPDGARRRGGPGARPAGGPHPPGHRAGRGAGARWPTATSPP